MLSGLCLAQSSTSARLSGSVTDTSGALVSNAQLTAADLETGLVTAVASDAIGNYAFNSLPVGHYKITVAADRFETLVETGVPAYRRRVRHVEFQIESRRFSRDGDCPGGPELIDTTTAELSQVVGEDTIKDLPLNGRDPGTLVLLSAGVTNELNSNASTLQTTNSFPNESGASAGGQRQGSTWYLLDGVSHMDTVPAACPALSQSRRDPGIPCCLEQLRCPQWLRAQRHCEH